MYLSTTREADEVSGVERGRVRGLVSANVFALGLVSLLTDVSAEMVTAVLPLYVVVQLGLSPLAFGLLDGIYGGVSAFVRLVGGHLADRGRRHKLIAGVGYGLSALTKPALLAASTVPGIAALLALDRTGKGLRTAPRDALISLSSPADAQGRAFGVHRAMDTVGALLGPLAAFGILWVAADAYDAVFAVSACIAVLAVLLLALFVRQPPGNIGPRSTSASLRRAVALLRVREVRRICLCAALLGLVTVSDAFIYLLVSKRLDLDPRWFPLLALGTAGAFLLLALPLGLIADRFGRWPVFITGHIALLAAYVLLLAPFDGLVPVIGILALLGTFYAATDGVLMAAASPLLPAEIRASGLALVQTGQALARFCCSLAFGAAWTLWGTNPAITTFAIALVAAVTVSIVLRPGPAPVPVLTGR